MSKESFLNTDRPPVFCPGCSHERVVYALDKAFQRLKFEPHQIVLVSDIGCSGLFDTFFNTHAVHGLHGRALTYATGIKMARPDLHVVVTMGDGGLGIGGAHVISACKRNLDITLLVLNNFNYGMTGGQCSATTPSSAVVSSGFLNRLEKPLDVCLLVKSAGAGWVARTSVYEKDLVSRIEEAINFDGFSVLDIWGICTGRFVKRNKTTPGKIKDEMKALPPCEGIVPENQRLEYSKHYRKLAVRSSRSPEPLCIEACHRPPDYRRQEVIILGSAGQRILTAGELLCIAGATAGMHASQKSDYPITIMRGHSVTEVILSPEAIDFTGIENPTIVVAIAEEGIRRRSSVFSKVSEDGVVLVRKGLHIPKTRASVIELDFKQRNIKPQDWALASLAWLASKNIALSIPMLKSAIEIRFRGSPALEQAIKIAEIWS